MVFDVKNQMMKCIHCDSVFDPKTYSRDTAAVENGYEGIKLYTCQNCGAELLSMESEAVTYCSYCGSEAVLESELSGDNHPRYIIPFKISKDQCKSLYNEQIKKKWYVPAEFKSPEFIDKFRGIYIPYWMYYVQFRSDPIQLEGSRSYTSGSYDYYEDYLLTTKLNGNGLYGVPFDASRNFDDTIAEQIAPFKKEQLVEYKEGYLAGMYADRPNVGAELYRDDVLEEATDTAINDIKKKFSGINVKVPNRSADRQELLDSKFLGYDAVLLPVWFLTWKKNDRVAYAVVNGQTGKVHIDLPIDKLQFMKFTAIAAALLFVLLTLFVSVTSRFVLWFSALLLYLVGRKYYSELVKIRDKDNHVFDKGYLLMEGDNDISMSDRSRERLRKRKKLFSNFSLSSSIGIIMFVVFGFFGFGFIGILFDIGVSQEGAIGMTAVILLLEIILFIKSILVSIHLKNKSSILTAILSMGAIGYSWFVALSQPVQDWWYYLGALICLIVSSIVCFDLIGRFNDASTRPLPSFYTRKGGNDNA
ncbi:MAG: hypothetical protein IJH64_15395 [Oscillospiraceae bacterium]|nr:hypothetical protein [Oscillospiraceae bacterium]